MNKYFGSLGPWLNLSGLVLPLILSPFVVLPIVVLIVGMSSAHASKRSGCVTGYGDAISGGSEDDRQASNVILFRPRSVPPPTHQAPLPAPVVSAPVIYEVGRLAEIFENGSLEELSQDQLRRAYSAWLEATSNLTAVQKEASTFSGGFNDIGISALEKSLKVIDQYLNTTDLRSRLAARGLKFGPELFYAPTRISLPKRILKRIITLEILVDAHRELKLDVINRGKTLQSTYATIKNSLSHIEDWIGRARPFVGNNSYEPAPILKMAADIEAAFFENDAFLRFLDEAASGAMSPRTREPAVELRRRIENLRTPLAYLRANGRFAPLNDEDRAD